jgi:exosome complex component RRP4
VNKGFLILIERWLVDIRSYDLAGLHINSVRLLEVQRRKTEEDEQRMKLYLSEGYNLLSEIKSVNYEEKMISLHVRTEKFGKLENGFLVPVNNCLVNKMKTAFHYLDQEILVVFAVNGFIWIQESDSKSNKTKMGGFKDPSDSNAIIEESDDNPNTSPINKTQKMIILKNIVECLNKLFVVISPETLFGVYRKFNWEAKRFRDPSNYDEIIEFIKVIKKIN